MKSKIYVFNQDIVADVFSLCILIFGIGFYLGAKYKEKQLLTDKKKEEAEGS